jgi:hypothetical protein
MFWDENTFVPMRTKPILRPRVDKADYFQIAGNMLGKRTRIAFIARDPEFWIRL